MYYNVTILMPCDCKWRWAAAQASGASLCHRATARVVTTRYGSLRQSLRKTSRGRSVGVPRSSWSHPPGPTARASAGRIEVPAVTAETQKVFASSDAGGFDPLRRPVCPPGRPSRLQQGCCHVSPLVRPLHNRETASGLPTGTSRSCPGPRAFAPYMLSWGDGAQAPRWLALMARCSPVPVRSRCPPPWSRRSRRACRPARP